MKRILTALITTALNPKTAIFGIALLAGLLSFSQSVSAATAYYVNARDVYARPRPGSYAMGRLYTNQRMDIQYVDPNGWAYGYAYGYVNRCVWMQFYNNNFWTHGTTVSTKCRTTNKYLSDSEFTNGEIWSNSSGTDGLLYAIPRPTYMWDNWSWGNRWGNHNYRGYAPAGTYFKIRYTTSDGGGVMVRPCGFTGAGGALECYSDWFFIQRSSL